MIPSIETVKKSNCHLHLTGALTPDIVRSVANKTDVNVSAQEPLESHLEFDDPTMWAATKEITSNGEGLLLALVSIINKERQDNVRYLETTVNTFGMVRRGMTLSEIADTLSWVHEYARGIGTEVKIKFGVNRKDGPDSVDLVYASYDSTPDHIRSTIDLNGDEISYPTADFVSDFAGLTRRDIPVSVHAGEMPGTLQSLRDALRIQPNRIAHAVVSIEDETVIDEFKARDITIEVATISNLRRGAVASLMALPLRRLLEKDVKVIFGTDDPGFFNNTMSDELRMLRHFGFSPPEIVAINQQANDHVGMKE